MPKTIIERLTRREREIMNALFALAGVYSDFGRDTGK
jgi:hypothetical protein